MTFKHAVDSLQAGGLGPGGAVELALKAVAMYCVLDCVKGVAKELQVRACVCVWGAGMRGWQARTRRGYGVGAQGYGHAVGVWVGVGTRRPLR